MLSTVLRGFAENRIAETGGTEIHTLTHDDPLAAVQIAAVYDALDQMTNAGLRLEPAHVQSAIDGVLGPGGQTIRARTEALRARLERAR